MNGPNLPPVAASSVVIRASPSPYTTTLLAYHILGQEMLCMFGSCVLGVCVCVCVCVCGEGAGEYCGPSQKPKRELYPLKLVNRSNL